MKLTAQDPLSRCFRVFIDGEDRSNDCTMVDTAEGIAEVFVRNSSGKTQLNASRTDMLKTIVHSSDIKLIRRPLLDCVQRMWSFVFRARWDSWRLSKEIE